MELKKDEILVLKNVKQDMYSFNHFKWPKKGMVTAPDFEPTYKCGNGLHALPWGAGGNYWIDEENDKWLVVKVSTSPDNYVHGDLELDDKCKFKTGMVVYCGTKEKASELISKHAPPNTPIWFANQVGGNEVVQVGGNGSTQTAGNKSTQTAGYESTQTARWHSTQIAGNNSYQKAGINSVQTIFYQNKVKTRVVTKELADKWFKFEGEDWRECTKEEVKKLEE